MIAGAGAEAVVKVARRQRVVGGAGVRGNKRRRLGSDGDATSVEDRRKADTM